MNARPEMNAAAVNLNDAIVDLARDIGSASKGGYARVNDITGLVREEAVRIDEAGYVWENYRDTHRGGSIRPVTRAVRKAVFDAVCFAVARDIDFPEALNEAAGYRNRLIVRPGVPAVRVAA